MSETEIKAGVSAEAKSAATEFLSTFMDFKENMNSQINEMTTRINALDRKSSDPRRLALATTAERELPHAKAMASYIRKGDEDGLRALDVETKGLNTATLNEGGYLVDPQTADSIENVLKSGTSLRALSNVVQIEAGAYDVLVDHNHNMEFAWNTESGSIGETSAPVIDRISIPLHELSASPTASQRILDDSAFDIETWLGERIGERFLRAESDAFVNGTGTNQPSGFLTKTQVADGSWSWGNIGYIATGTDGDFDPNSPADVLVDLVYALEAEYRAGAAFVMSSSTAGEVRKMKDSQGRFLWLERNQPDLPPLLLGFPVLIVEAMPAISSGSFSIAFGNFRKGYTIAERPDLRILRDPYSAKPNVMFYATKRVGGDVSDYAAIKTLKFGVS